MHFLYRKLHLFAEKRILTTKRPHSQRQQPLGSYLLPGEQPLASGPAEHRTTEMGTPPQRDRAQGLEKKVPPGRAELGGKPVQERRSARAWAAATQAVPNLCSSPARRGGGTPDAKTSGSRIFRDGRMYKSGKFEKPDDGGKGAGEAAH